MTTHNSVTILLVEDDDGHSYLIAENLLRGGVKNPVIKIADGLDAVDFLFCRGKYAGEKLPSPLLVLLDLNLPGKDGHLILKEMKENEATKRIPVIILTTTEDAREIKECYDLGCNVFMTKPVDYSKFGEAIRKLGLFIEVVQIPNGVD